MEFNWKSPLAQFSAIENCHYSDLVKVYFTGALNGVMYCSTNTSLPLSALNHHNRARDIRMILVGKRIVRSMTGNDDWVDPGIVSTQDVKLNVKLRLPVGGFNDWTNEARNSAPDTGMYSRFGGVLVFSNRLLDDGVSRDPEKAFSFSSNPDVLSFCRDWADSRGLSLYEEGGFSANNTEFPFREDKSMVRLFLVDQNMPSLLFYLNDNIGTISERVQSFTWWSESNSYQISGTERAVLNGDRDGLIDSINYHKSVMRDQPYSRNALQLIPLTGAWGLLDNISANSVVSSMEKVVDFYLIDGQPREVEIRTLTIDVDAFGGVISVDDIESYYYDALGLMEPKPKDNPSPKFWSEHPLIEFSKGSFITAENLDVRDLSLAKRYNRARKKACKTENFLDTEFEKGVTWKTVNNGIQAMDRNKMVWVTDYGNIVGTKPYVPVGNPDKPVLEVRKVDDAYNLSLGTLKLACIIDSNLPVLGSDEFAALENFLIEAASSNWVIYGNKDDEVLSAALYVRNQSLADDDKLSLISISTADTNGDKLVDSINEMRMDDSTNLGFSQKQSPFLRTSGKIAAGDSILMLAVQQVTAFKGVGNVIGLILNQVMSATAHASLAALAKKSVDAPPAS